MIIVKTKIVRALNAAAFTAFPFIFVDPEILADKYWAPLILKHEGVHLQQQKRWAIYGLGVGLLAWFLLYLLALPIVVNPFRKKWETEAYKTEGYSDDQIKSILKQAPYFLLY